MSLAELSQQPGKVETLVKSGPYIEDPLSAFEQVCNSASNCLLLESAEIDSKDNLKSLILIDAAVKFVCDKHTVTCRALTDNGQAVLLLLENVFAQVNNVNLTSAPDSLRLTFQQITHALDEDSRLKAASVFDVLRKVINSITPLRSHPHSVFLGGAFAYDLLATFENLPDVAESDNTCPDYVFYLAETMVIIDHQTRKTELIGSVFSGEHVASQYFAISQRLEALSLTLASVKPGGNSITASTLAANVTVNESKSDEAFRQDVVNLKEHILAGDIFQVVPSRTFSLPCPLPYQAYRNLKKNNPSPYMFFLKDEDFVMFGASPESALKYDHRTNQVEIYPIAGTRPRGKRADGTINRDLDSRIELNLREDEKEKAEHLMLVDLARNDVARVSKPGSRFVKDLLKVDRYSHVMHLVSRVVGELRDDLDALHAYQACMNMGTLVGAPKVSAATLIREVEQLRRGSYGGAVGYINGEGDMDTCIVIRSAFVKDGIAHIQAGAGVVYDSDPQSEADETRSKAQAVISAIKAVSTNGGSV